MAFVVRLYAEERKLVTMQEALRKISLMPAQTMGGFVPQMKRKARLQEVMDADIVVFDPDKIAEKATYKDHNHPAAGVQAVLVNSVPEVADGELAFNIALGRPIRRPTAK